LTAPLRRWFAPAIAVVVAATLLAPAAPAQAAPNSDTPAETETPLLKDVIESTSRSYLQAKTKLQQSQKREAALNIEVQKAQARLDELSPQVGQIAAVAYRTGRVGGMAVLLQSSSPDSFVERAVRLDELNRANDRKLAELNAARDTATRAKAALDAEILEQRKQVAIMNKQKTDAEKAFELVGGYTVTRGLVDATSKVAAPAPRTANGGWPDESCSENDPTTSGCVTPRTLHAYKEVRKAGFDKFAGCYRPGGPFEHPKGRACDWSLINKGFVSFQNNSQMMYGNNLAAFLVRNAERLGILYVIWNKQIWWTGDSRGWHAYRGVSDHTDHVHMSMM
jgi:hypothetical protein